MMGALSAGMLIPGTSRPLAASGLVIQQAADRLAAFRASFANTPIQTQQLADNLTLLSGPGGNVLVLHGAGGGTDGLVVVDNFVSTVWTRLEEQLKSFGAPVKFVINTHWHLDHTDNNAPLHAAGATIVAHENTKRRMSEPHHLPMLELDVPASPVAALPQRVFTDGWKHEANGEKVEVSHVAPAHTDTDVILRFERANLVHAGDVFFNGRYPFIDWSTGGRIDGMIAAADRVLSIVDADTRIVPGHGRLATRADLEKYRDMLVTARNRVRALKTSGKSLEESIAAKPLTDLDGVWGNGRFKGDDFVKIVYSTL
jgi:glyoxylase-like metal-dependent hydrolase (beta-lactamase superfamily II)